MCFGNCKSRSILHSLGHKSPPCYFYCKHISVANTYRYLFQGGSVFPIFCDELPDEKNWRKNAEKSAWRSTNEEKENKYNDEKNSWRSKDENCAPVAAASRPLQRNKVGLT